MEASSDDWELIGDITDGDVIADRYIPPVAKASLALPPPSIHTLVPLRLFRSHQSCVHRVLQMWYPHQRSPHIQVADLQRMIYLHFIGIVRVSIVHHQVTDLDPGVNDRPIRAGYQPQSFRLQAKPPQSLQSSRTVNEMISDLPPPPPEFFKGIWISRHQHVLRWRNGVGGQKLSKLS